MVFDEEGYGTQQDVQIQRRRPVLDVEVIQADRLLGPYRRASLDLPPARDTRADLVARSQQLEVRRDLFGGEGTRTDQTHLAAKHVQQLGELVKAPFPEPLAEPCEAGVVLQLEVWGGRVRSNNVAVGIGRKGHRAELVHPERPAALRDPFLTDTTGPAYLALISTPHTHQI